MLKHLFLIHLEGLSQQMLWQYQHEFSHISSLRNAGMSFLRCFVHAPFTVGGLSSVLFGSMTPFDYHHQYSFSSIDNMSLMRWLRDNHDYQSVVLFCFPKTVTTHNAIADSFFSDADVVVKMFIEDDWGSKLRNALAGLDSDRPIFLYFVNIQAYNGPLANVSRKTRDATYSECIAEEFALYDALIKRVTDILCEHISEQDLMTVAYGDHGTRISRYLSSDTALQNGVGLDSELCHVPMFIHNSPLGQGTTNKLAALSDIPFIVSNLLTGGKSTFTATALHPGQDILRDPREFVCEQNKYALQNSRARENETPKMYALTDGDLRLVVTDDQGGPLDGMQLFCEQYDYMNDFNILEFFDFDSAGMITSLSRHALDMSGNVLTKPYLLNPLALEATVNKFYRMRDTLARLVGEKEESALRHPEAREHTFSMEAFKHPIPTSYRLENPSPKPFLKTFHELEKAGEPAYIFGYNFITPQIIAVLETLGIAILGILDNKRAPGEVVAGIRVVALSEAQSENPGAIIISSIMSEDNDGAVTEQCVDAGFRYYSYIKDVVGYNLY